MMASVAFTHTCTRVYTLMNNEYASFLAFRSQWWQSMTRIRVGLIELFGRKMEPMNSYLIEKDLSLSQNMLQFS